MFRMPAEWCAHQRTWMIWPCRAEVWEGRLAATRAAYADLARAIRQFEPVTMIADPAEAAGAQAILGAEIEVLALPVDDSWARDQLPCFVHDGKRLAASCFRFNAWGNKYHPHDRDAALAGALSGAMGVPAHRADLVAEGGAISVDGEGTVLTTETCLLNENRNPGLDKAEVTARLNAALGTEKVIWLPGNADEIETDGHVDCIAVFTAPGEVLAEAPGAPDHPWHAIRAENIRALEGATDAMGRPLTVRTLLDANSAPDIGSRFCKSYLNYYLPNGGVVMPAYGVPEDGAAREILADVFPDRTLVQVPVSDIALGGGGIHCVTQQEPKVANHWS
ncbi:MAG: agmatine deiminase family protein [Pseudomonadota bacterium]